MENEQLLSELKDILKVICPNKDIDYDKVNEESLLLEELHFDSITLLMMAIAIEREYDVEVLQLDSASFKKVKDVIDYIKERI